MAAKMVAKLTAKVTACQYGKMVDKVIILIDMGIKPRIRPDQLAQSVRRLTLIPNAFDRRGSSLPETECAAISPGQGNCRCLSPQSTQGLLGSWYLWVAMVIL